MKRLALCVMSVCLLTSATGCCWSPGMPMWGGGCQNGQCGVNPYGSLPPQGACLPQNEMIQTNYAPIATAPVYGQPTTMAYPQQIGAPTMAVESLPTYR